MARTTTALKVVVEWNLWAAIVVDLHLPPIPTTVALFVPIVSRAAHCSSRTSLFI